MSQRIPLDFPKVWPYSQPYRDHVMQAVRLKEAVSLLLALGILLIALGFAGTFLFGTFQVYSVSRFFGCFIPTGIVLAIVGHLRHKKKFARVMDEATKQADLERSYLRGKALVPLSYDGPEDLVNKALMEQAIEKHYTPNWVWVRNKLLYRDGFSCCFCGRRVQLGDSVAHHIAAFSEGGRTELSNLVTICVECHSIIHPWLNPTLNLFWIRLDRGRVYCWKCKSRLDSPRQR